MDDLERDQRRAGLRDPMTYATVGEWWADYRGFAPIQMAHGLSRAMRERGLTFPEAYRLLRGVGAIVEIVEVPGRPRRRRRSRKDAAT